MTFEPLPFQYNSPVICIAHSLKHKLLAVGQIGRVKENPTVTLWRYEEKQQMKIVETGESRNISALSFVGEDNYLVYSVNGKLMRYSIADEKKTEVLDDVEINCNVANSKTSRIILSGHDIRVVDVDSLKTIWHLNIPEKETMSEPPVVEMFEDGKIVIVNGHNKNMVQCFNIESNEITRDIKDGPLESICMSLGCKEQVLGISSKAPKGNWLWDLNTGQRILPDIFNDRIGGYTSICLHPTKKVLASGSFVGFVALQELTEGKFIFSERIHKSRVSQLLITEDGVIFSCGEDGSVFIGYTDI
jgi:WD40 repeat protein